MTYPRALVLGTLLVLAVATFSLLLTWEYLPVAKAQNKNRDSFNSQAEAQQWMRN